MPTNVEVKARIGDFEKMASRAAALSDRPAQVLHQEDTFFATPAGRLKLRLLGPGDGQLIYYERPDRRGPKTSRYFISPTSDPESLKTLLSACHGVRGVVKKTRHLYLHGNTRIHLDKVEGLGIFLELEVVLQPGQDPTAGEQIAAGLMARLGIVPADLIDGAYMDLLEQDRGP